MSNSAYTASMQSLIGTAPSGGNRTAGTQGSPGATGQHGGAQLAGTGALAATAAHADPIDTSALLASAAPAANFLKAQGHDGRLMILCHLIDGPKSVTELEGLLSARQAVVSQQLARLRHEGLVRARREGQSIIYSIHDTKVVAAIALLSQLYQNAAQDR